MVASQGREKWGRNPVGVTAMFAVHPLALIGNVDWALRPWKVVIAHCTDGVGGIT